MFLIPLIGLLAVAGFSVYKLRRMLTDEYDDRDEEAVPLQRTLLDPLTSDDALSLVRLLSMPHTTSEDLSCRLLALFKRFPPDEECVQAMSLEQQRLNGHGGKEEYAVCTVYAAMMMHIMNVEERPKQYVHGQKYAGRMDEAPIVRRWSDSLYLAAAPMVRSSPGSKSTE